MDSIGRLIPTEYMNNIHAPYVTFPTDATYASTAPRIGPTHGIQTMPSDMPRKKAPSNPSLAGFEELLFKKRTLCLKLCVMEPDNFTNSIFISSSKSTAPIPIIKRMDRLLKVSAKPPKAAPKPETSVPMMVKLSVMPDTIATGRSLPPAEPDITTGTSGRQHGFRIVTSPAAKIRMIEGAEAGIFFKTYPC